MGRHKLVILFSLLVILVGCVKEAPVSQVPLSTGHVVVRQSGGAGLLIAECRDKQYIISKADYIVEGVVERVESRWNEDKSAIFTYTSLSIQKCVKGIPFAVKELEVVTPGGTVGNITQMVEDQPLFHEGKGIRIYFQEINGEFWIVCGGFGVEELGAPGLSPSR